MWLWKYLYLPLIFALKPSFVLVLIGYSGVLVDKLLSVRVLGRVAINLLSSLKLKLRVTSCRRAGTGRGRALIMLVNDDIFVRRRGPKVRVCTAVAYGKISVQRKLLHRKFCNLKLTVSSVSYLLQLKGQFIRKSFKTILNLFFFFFSIVWLLKLLCLFVFC